MAALAVSATLAWGGMAPGFTIAASPNAVCDTNSSVPLDGHQVCGERIAAENKGGRDVFVYRGIKYATAERWENPKPYKQTADIKALQFGAVCPQSLSPAAQASHTKYSEDCLFVNVWRPASVPANVKLPVMVFIHGGAFLTGAGSDFVYDGTAFARRGAILVTLNYRLGALGFLYAKGGQVNADGNYGLRDQQEALHWVNDNIAAFGGDLSRITVFGESAGAMSTALHTFDVPTSAKFFQSAIMESDVGGSVFQSAAAQIRQGNGLLNTLCKMAPPPKGVTCGADWLKKRIPATVIVDHQFSTGDKGGLDVLLHLLEGSTLPWSPVVDGTFVMGQPFDGYAAGMPAKPVAFGINADEGAMFLAMPIKMAHLVIPNPAKAPTPAEYEFALKKKFGTDPDVISVDPERYGPRGHHATSGYSAAGAAFANVITDYVFACGDELMASKSAGKDQPVYAYYFSQPIFFSFLEIESLGKNPVDNGACDPKWGLTCHGTELPYVFDTVKLIPQIDPAYPLGATDADVARDMNAAWFAFASDPRNPGPLWKSYKDGAKAVQWHGTVQPDGSITTQGDPYDIADNSHCTFWHTKPPYNGTAVSQD